MCTTSTHESTADDPLYRQHLEKLEAASCKAPQRCYRQPVLSLSSQQQEPNHLNSPLTLSTNIVCVLTVKFQMSESDV